MRVTELTNGFRLLVGRDLEERRRLFGIVAKAAQWSLLVVIVLGIGGGIFVARRVLRRIDAMTGTTQRIMAGDLSGRLAGRALAATSSIASRKISTPCWSASRR